ncbi:hypothetical protein B0H10DRAFT_2214273 [Mycena sp. CBHHK59/15]|nr:hypothetical protein B0H10DRAFT_2214273 [Mycena sp. CBHHK59/15]
MSATTIARLLLFLPDALAAYDAPSPSWTALPGPPYTTSLSSTRLLLSLPDALAAFSDGPPSPSRAALSAPPYATWLSLPHALEPCVVTKHAKAPSPENQSQIAISSADGDRSKGLVCTVQAPAGSRRPSTGQNIAAAHGLAKAPITDLQWSLVCSPTLYTVSANASLTATDVRMGQCVRRVRAAHRGVINALGRTMGGGSGAELVATAADNNTVRVCDMSEDGGKLPIAEWDVGCPVTAACWSKDGASMYAAALDNEIHVIPSSSFLSFFAHPTPKVYDLRSSAALHTLGGHTDTPTSLALLPIRCRCPHGGPGTDRGPAALTPRGVAPASHSTRTLGDYHLVRLQWELRVLCTPVTRQFVSMAVTYVPIGRIEHNCVDRAIGTCTLNPRTGPGNWRGSVTWHIDTYTSSCLRQSEPRGQSV